MVVQELQGEELKDHLHDVYLRFREECKESFGPDRPMLPDELFEKYAGIFREMLDNPYVYTRDFAESSYGEVKSPEEVDREMEMTYEIGWMSDIAGRRQLEEELAQTHIKLDQPFDLIGYKQYCGTSNIQSAVLGAWPIHSFLFRDQQGEVFYWQQQNPLWLANKRGWMQGSEVVIKGSLHGYHHLEDISKALGFDRKEFDDLCIELPNQVNVDFNRASRPLLVNTLETTYTKYEDYWKKTEEDRELDIEDIGEYRILSGKLREGISAVNPVVRNFQIVSREPLIAGIDPRRVKHADGRYGYDGIIDIRGSRILENLVVPYKINAS